MLILDVRAPLGTNSVGTYFDSCVFLIMFILLGRTLEAFAKLKTTDAVSLLGLLRPDTALFVDPQLDESDVVETAMVDSASSRYVPVDRLERGDLLIIQPGSLPPTDGIIVSGSTTLDESSLTGESLGVPKGPGDEIFTGTINKSSAIVIRVTSLASETMLERIIAAVSNASAHKAPLEKLAEKLTGVFVPVIVYIAIVVLTVWISVTLGSKADVDTASPGGRVFFAFEFAISTLIVACPCGIGLAIPCANAVGNGIAARAGILASGGGQAFMAATKVKTIVLDKTGTLTIGKSMVTDEEYPGDPTSCPVMMQAIREVESQSTHPLALGLVNHIDQKSTDRVEIIESNEVAGRGIRARTKVVEDTIDLLVGNVPFMLENGVAISESCESSISKWSTEAKSVVLVAKRSDESKDYRLSAMFALSDPPRESTFAVLACLRGKGYHLVMLSGDNERTAQAVGKLVGIEEKDVRAGVGPEEKAGVIRELQRPAEPSEGNELKVCWKGWKSSIDTRQDASGVMFVGGKQKALRIDRQVS